MVTFDDILAARDRLQGHIHRSPLEFTEALSALTGNRVWLKLENLQRTGSFKDRGSLNKLLTLTEAERAAGVICASAGNHGQGVASAAQRLGLVATVVMPVGSPLVKATACRSFGAEVVLFGTNYDEACGEARRLATERGLTWVHAFDDPVVIAGQGTVGLEILEQLPETEAIVVPVGGGGLIGGIALAVKSLNPKVRVYGVETERVASMEAALAAGKIVDVPGGRTLADGIAVRRAGEHTFPLVRDWVDGIATVDEEEIASAILTLMEREKTVAEGAGATPLAALANRKLALSGRRVVLVVSGGNIDVNILSRIIERGLVKDGRLMRMMVRIPDVPGALAKLTTQVAETRANIVEIHHQRAFSTAELGETDVELTLETRGPDHIDELRALLTGAGYRVVPRA
ncbi:MAG: threonine ammonia-lyase [bacterium]